jgi:Flp pilus assembly protein TadD
MSPQKKSHFQKGWVPLAMSMVACSLSLGVLTCKSTSEIQQSELKKEVKIVTFPLSLDDSSDLYIEPDATHMKAFQLIKAMPDQTSGKHLTLTAAETALMAGQVEESIRLAKLILLADLNHRGAKKILIKANLYQNKWDQAQLLAENLLKSEKNDPSVYNLLGVVFSLKGDFTRARSHWHKGLTLNPNHVSLNLNMAALYLQTKHYEQAQRHLQNSLKYNDKAWDAMTGNAIVMASKGQNEESKSQLESVLSDHPKSSLALYHLAVLHREKFQNQENRSEQYKKSLDYLNRYFETVQNKKQIFEHAVVMREELRTLIANGGKPLTDEQLRSLAKNQSAALSALEASATESSGKGKVKNRSGNLPSKEETPED